MKIVAIEVRSGRRSLVMDIIALQLLGNNFNSCRQGKTV